MAEPAWLTKGRDRVMARASLHASERDTSAQLGELQYTPYGVQLYVVSFLTVDTARAKGALRLAGLIRCERDKKLLKPISVRMTG